MEYILPALLILIIAVLSLLLWHSGRQLRAARELAEQLRLQTEQGDRRGAETDAVLDTLRSHVGAIRLYAELTEEAASGADIREMQSEIVRLSDTLLRLIPS